MENNNNNNKKKLTWAVGLIAGLGILSIAYAALSSTLTIKGDSATINTGYIHFTDVSKAYGIGSTNSEYSTDGKTSGGLFPARDDNNSNGLILAGSFDKNWAKALAKPGKFELGDEHKVNDKVTITGAELNDFGSFIVYELHIFNESTSPMRLRSLPEIKVEGLTSGAGAVSEANIERKIYEECSPANFVEPCSTELKECEGDDDTRTDGNYIIAGGNTTWYLRIGFKNYDKNTNSAYGTTTFNFSVVPEWEAVMS